MSIFNQNDVIAAVKTEEDLVLALGSNVHTIFLLKANINSAVDWVERCRNVGKRVFIHTDLAEGFGRDDASIDYIANTVKPDGILSTKIGVVRTAAAKGLCAVYRVFLIDQQSMESAYANISKYNPFAVEIMPGIAYEAIRELHERTNARIIAGGFVKNAESVALAIEAGARACSTSSKALWVNKH